MFRKFIVGLSRRPWLRIALAVLLLIIGLAPVGAPILSSGTMEQPRASASAADVSYGYRWLVDDNGESRIQRSEAGRQASEWVDIGRVPDAINQLEPAPGNPKLFFARSQNAIWRSEDGGVSWTRTAFPSQPMSLAVARQTPGLLLAGSQSMGLFRSVDNGATWQSVGQALMSGGAGAMGISAVAINSEDERVIYAAPGYWLGTTDVRFSPLGTFVSVDSGTSWFPMVDVTSGGQTGRIMTDRITQFVPVEGRPLAVTALASPMSAEEPGMVQRRFDMPITPEFVKRLDDPDRNVRAVAARTLGLSGNSSAVQPLLDHLYDEDVFVGDQVAEALGRVGGPSVVPALEEALAHQDEAVRARAAYGLGLLKTESAVPALTRMLREDGPLARSRAADALGEIGTPEAVNALISSLSDAELTAMRQAAMQGLRKVGEPAVQPLAAALNDENASLRRNSAEMLGWLRAENATAALADALKDQEPAVRSQAAWALGEIGTLPAQQALAQAARSEGDAQVRVTAQHALAQAQERGAAPTSRGEAIMEALTQIPASRWTFLGLLLVLAVILLALNPRELQADRHVRA